MEGTNLPAAFDKRDNGTLLDAAFAVLEVGTAFTLWRDIRTVTLADIGFVGFYGFAFATKGAGGVCVLFHGLTNAVGHEPSGFIGNAQHAM